MGTIGQTLSSDSLPRTARRARRQLSSFLNPRAVGQNHLFVDNVRFWSMLAIVAIHSASLFTLLQPAHSKAVQAVTSPFKFGTVAFFLISGFLLGERLETCNPLDYFSRRLHKVFLPWLLWLSLSFVCFVVAHFNYHQSPAIQPDQIPGVIYGLLGSYLFSTAFWFVPNLLAGIGVLLLFRRHLNRLWLGAVLLAVNLFYVVNIYKLWFRSEHTQALFAFVFHLWLGAYAVRHFATIRRWISGVPTWTLGLLSVLTGLAAFGETRLLSALNNPDPLNSLRLSNQVFSLCVVLLLFKLPKGSWPRFINVRRHTFGIYLSHTIVLSVFSRLIKHGLRTDANLFWRTDAGGLLLWLLLFTLTYSACVLLSTLLADSSRLQWTIGVEPPRSPRPLPGPAQALLATMQ